MKDLQDSPLAPMFLNFCKFYFTSLLKINYYSNLSKLVDIEKLQPSRGDSTLLAGPSK